MNVNESWDRIEAWLAKEAVDMLPSLRPGASADAIAKLESTLGVALPKDFRDSVLRHDGQVEGPPSGLFPQSGVLGAEPAWELFSLQEIRDFRSDMNSMATSGEFCGRKSKLSSGEDADWWSTHWAPVAHNGGSDYAVLDLTPGNTFGRVLHFRHDSQKRDIFAPSFGRWLEQLADNMDAGLYIYEPGDLGLMEKEDDE